MRSTYSGKYRVRRPEKYAGDPAKVSYRSSWERAAFLFLERSPLVLEWSSEEIIVPYICATDRQPHRYFVDLKVKWADGRTELIEIKPSKQAAAPKRKGKKRAKFLEEAAVYAKNQSKWMAARKWAEKHGMNFVVWDEEVLRKMGILRW